MTNIARSEFKIEIRRLGATQLKKLVAELWNSQEWETQILGSQAQSAIDIVATSKELIQRKEIIHIKQYGNDKLVSPSAIRNCNTASHYQDNTDAVILVTTGNFSEDAELLAQDLNVKLVDYDDLYDFFEETESFDILYQYI